MSSDGRGSGQGIAGLAAQDAAAQETMAFLLRLRARGISHVNVLRALETVPRLAFVPHRYADLALRDMALPIPCGQTMSEPFILARILEALNLNAKHRVLEIGTGSGYGAALLARLTGDVVSYERFRTLSLEAEHRLRGLGVTNVTTIWGDGLAIDEQAGLFDRILIDGAVPADVAQRFLENLAQGGILVCALQEEAGDRARLTRIAHTQSGFVHNEISRCRAAALLVGTAQTL